MNIEELRKSVGFHLSVSSCADYLDCGLRYRFKKIDGYQSEYISDNLLFGSAIHEVLADYQSNRMKHNILNLDDLQNLFEYYWQRKAEAEENILYSEGKTFDILLKEGKALLKAFYDKQEDQGYKVLAVEEAFEFRLDDIPIIGVVDLIEEDECTVVITDYKTSSRAYSFEEVSRNFQLSVYYLQARSNGYADKEIVLKIDALIKTKIPKYEQYYTARSDLDVRRTIKKIQAIYDGIRKGVFIPNDLSWKCGEGCGFKKYCDDWFGGPL